MTRKPVLVQLSDELIARLDRLGDQTGESRSAIVREAVERYVVQKSNEEWDRQMVEAYTRIPDDDEFDAWAEESLREMVEEEPW